MTTNVRTRPRGLVAALLAALVALTGPTAAAPAVAADPLPPPGAAQAADPARTADVMTRNLYLGAGLDAIVAALASGNPAQVVGAATATWNTVQASDPAERMAAIADEIAASRPAVVGLQEVTTWSTYPYNPATGATGSPTVAYDFLDLLLTALAERGMTYHEVPGATAHNFASQPIPVLTGAAYPTTAVSLADRDVILRRDDVRAWNGQHGNFTTILRPPASPLRVDRGWGSADVRTRLATFRVVNAHTEAWGPEALRVAQVSELFAAQAAIAATAGPLPTVYVGDYNSSPGEAGYATLAAQLGDAWVATNPGDPGYTCCQLPSLTNATSLLDERIDLVMTGTGLTATATHLTGTTIVDLPGATAWASDHAGVVARLVVAPPE